MLQRGKMVFALLMLCMFISGCEEQLFLGNLQQIAVDQAESAPICNAGPKKVDTVDANNKQFKQNLKAFNTEQDLYQMSEEEVWNWIMEAEKTFQQGVLQQFTYTDEQMEELKNWLSGYFDDKLRDERLKKAMEKIEGGYALKSLYSLYDINYKHVEQVINLELDKKNENHVVVHAELVVRQNQKVEVTYGYKKKDGIWKLTDYDFKLVE